VEDTVERLVELDVAQVAFDQPEPGIAQQAFVYRRASELDPRGVPDDVALQEVSAGQTLVAARVEEGAAGRDIARDRGRAFQRAAVVSPVVRGIATAILAHRTAPIFSSSAWTMTSAAEKLGSPDVAAAPLPCTERRNARS